MWKTFRKLPSRRQSADNTIALKVPQEKYTNEGQFNSTYHQDTYLKVSEVSDILFRSFNVTLTKKLYINNLADSERRELFCTPQFWFPTSTFKTTVEAKLSMRLREQDKKKRPTFSFSCSGSWLNVN